MKRAQTACLFIYLALAVASCSFAFGKGVADHWYATHATHATSGVTFSAATTITTPAFTITGEGAGLSAQDFICYVDKGRLKAAGHGKTRNDCIAALIKQWQKDSTEHYDEWPGWDGATVDREKAVHGT